MRIRIGAFLTCCIILLIAAGVVAPASTGGQSITRLTNTGLQVQEIQKPGKDAGRDAEKGPDASTTLYQVMAVVLFIWFGLAFFLFRLDRRVKRLEEKTNLEK